MLIRFELLQKFLLRFLLYYTITRRRYTCNRISFLTILFIQDEALSFIPTISLPSNAASFAFKRQFSPSDKLRLVV